MTLLKFIPLALLGVWLSACHTSAPAQTDTGFVTVEGTHFALNGHPYYYLGTNFWAGLNLGSKGSGGQRDRLLRELDRLQSLGINNLRIMGGSEGPDTAPFRMLPSLQTKPGVYNPEVLDGLDFLLSEMQKRHLYAIVCLNNFWNWSGGMSQYLVWAGAADSIPNPSSEKPESWGIYQAFTAQFYSNPKAVNLFNQHIRFIVDHVNPYTKKAYKDDPTIMAWELANEPRADTNIAGMHTWINETAGLLKSLDPHHLVTTGSEGATSGASAGTDLVRDHESPNIDYATIHIWVQNWNIYDPAKADATFEPAVRYAHHYLDQHVAYAQQLKKPLILEEFGISRDGNNYQRNSPTIIRDKYYQNIFDAVFDYANKDSSIVSGVNFWAWGGEGKPRVPGGMWKPGDDFLGDPPHEAQGWYSVFDNDSSTIQVIKTSAARFNGLAKK
ncbi:mannan endo-1,4-beta-mannosidase [Chitinophaga costaii]|uniref:mannan endo-1,4-beta-mannosidase n=1 Tax=Chitinophaga costaii TaxID=1335309 RepID=A0A1C4FEW0_9BACT|nr:glycoside hydrolase family 2 TIM barrel-domain containing protein [Chitinophaga costaii]PUZ20118.1 hypothetical protein DCM91_19485 [Chitinophaga costaii]SCC54577.1 mannan endo-1,4-beta-mannosidase [Chitinophaga costaii]